MTSERSRWLAWALLLAWLTWSTALSGALVQSPLVAGWAPDLALAIWISLAGFLSARDLPRLAIVAALARASVSIEAPLALLAGFLALAGLASGTRGFVDLRGPFARAGLTAVAAPALAAWLDVVRAARSGSGLALDGADLARLSLSSALLALVLGGVLARLPGLSPLRRREW